MPGEGSGSSPQKRARALGRRSPAPPPARLCFAAPTFPGPSPAHRPLRTTLPGRTRARARARAPGPPPWRLCCPGRSSSPVRRRSLATTLLPRAPGRPGGEALGAKPVGAWPQPQPQRRCGSAEASRCSPHGLGVRRHQGARGVQGWSGVAGAGRAWATQGRNRRRRAGLEAGARRALLAFGCQSARRRHPEGGLVREHPFLSAAGAAPRSPQLLCRGRTPGARGQGRPDSGPPSGAASPLHGNTDAALGYVGQVFTPSDLHRRRMRVIWLIDVSQGRKNSIGKAWTKRWGSLDFRSCAFDAS